MMRHLPIIIVTMLAMLASNATAQYSYEFTGPVYEGPGSQALGNADWMLTTDAGYFGYDNTKGQQIGSAKNPASIITLSTSDITGAIATVTVETSGASGIGAELTVRVGGKAFGDSYKLTTTSTSHTFTGAASGKIELIYEVTAGKAVYIKSIEVASGNGGDVPVVAPEIAKVSNIAAFNALPDGTEAQIYWSDEAHARVTFAYGKNAYIRDDTGALCLYGFDKQPAMTYNEHLAGYITGVKTMVGNMPVMQAGDRTNTSLLAIAAPVTEENVQPKVITMAELPQHFADWVVINDVSMVDAQTCADATGSMTVVNTFKVSQYTSVEVGKTFSISGIVNSTKTSGDRLSPVYNEATSRTGNPSADYSEEFPPVNATTGIANTSVIDASQSARAYDLTGRSVDPARMRGDVYIVGGKKIAR